jgi:YD repeat-containing protein
VCALTRIDLSISTAAAAARAPGGISPLEISYSWIARVVELAGKIEKQARLIRVQRAGSLAYGRFVMPTGTRGVIAAGVALLVCAVVTAHAQTRSVPEDFTTQMPGSDHSASLGPELFGDNTDLYTGATSFLVTDVSLPGNSDLPVALQRSLEASDSGLGENAPYRMPASFMTWTRYEVPYLSGVHAENWTAAAGSGSSYQRCSLTSPPPEIFDGKGLYGSWEPGEYWHGNHLYLPSGGSQEMLVAAGVGSPPTDGATYRWSTKNHWYFSCLPTTANGQPGEAFLARSPDGKKYFFNHLVVWGQLPDLRKFDDEQDEMVLSRYELRFLLTRVEDRFGNWVQYSYSGKDLTSITANDGRQLTLTYAAPGGALTSVSDGARTWTYSYTSGVSVTFPDSTTWQSTVSGPGIFRNDLSPSPDGSVACDNAMYSGERTLTIQARSGAVGTFVFRPLRRGLSHVFYNPVAAVPCPQRPKHFDNIALYSKTISGTGLPSATWNYVYGPANSCFATGPGPWNSAPCTGASLTTRYVEVSGPGTFTRYTFGNKYEDTDGTLFRIETGSSPSLILRDEALTWQTFPAPGYWGVSWLSNIVRSVATRTIAQSGATYATTNSNWDTYFRPQTVVESGPNGGSRTTQYTYHNDRAKWVIGQVATATSPGRSLSRTFNANALVASATEDGVTTSHTYHADGTVATTTTPRLHVHSFSNYKRGIAQSESHPEAVDVTRVVNNHGFVTSETNGESKTTSYGHDPVGRITSIDRPIGNDVSIAYSGATKSTKTTTRGGLVQTVTYDALWRPTTIVRGGITTTYQYDAYGRVTFQSNPNDSIGTTTEYDALGRITKITHPDSNYRSFTFGPGTVTERNERANLTTRTLRTYGDPDDALLMSIAAPESSANVSLTRDPNGLVRSVTQAGVTRNLDYDARNYLISETHPETGSTTFERDAAGNMTARTIGGVRTEFGYDGLNRLSSTNFPDTTPDITQTWSKTSQLKTVSSADAARTLGYDDNDNPTSESLAIGATTLSASYGYDGNDQLASITYPVSLRVVNYAPNALGRPTQVSGYATAVTYWPSGQMRQIDYANGTVSAYEQNSRLWPSAFYTRRGSFYSMSSTYGYDGAGNMTSIVDAVDGSMNRTLGYDGIDRLTSAAGPWGSGTIGYNGAGNITSQGLGSFALGYTYDAQNRLASVSGSRSASYGYDAAGNVTSAGGATYNYDAVPNMRCANCGAGNRTDYTYDGSRNRVKVVKSGVTTYEFHAANGDLLVEYTPSQASRLVEYIYLDGNRIAQRVSDSNAPTSITPTATTVTASESGAVTFGVNIGGTSPSGTVAFVKQGSVLGTAHVLTGSASVEVMGLGAGPHTLTATYSGDATYSANSLTYDLTVLLPPDTTPPTAPGTPAFSNISPTSATASWTAASDNRGVIGYDYRLNSGTWQSLGNVLSVNLTGLTPLTSYTFQVRARDAATNLGPASSNSFTAQDTTVPSVPTGLSGSAPSSSTVNLTWNAASDNVGVTGYRIYRNGSHIDNSATTSYSDGGRTGSMTYSYQVAAYDAATNVSGLSSSINVTTPDTIAPTTPTSLSASAVSPSQINLSWGGSSDSGGSGLAGYRVYRNGSHIANTGATSYSDTGLSGATTYSYNVAAYDNATNTSAQSNTANATTLPPVTVTVSNGNWRWRKFGSNPTQVDPPVVCTGSGGSGTGYTYAWLWVSGDTETSAISPTSNSTRWSRTVPNANATYSSLWRCRVTDSAGNTGQNSVSVTFIRTTNQ